MNEDMERKWDEAFANPGEAIPVGDIVLCDDCSVDYTNRPDSGGFIFQSKAICPVCAPRWRRLIALYGEQHFIKSVWLNPRPEGRWEHTPSLQMLRRLMEGRMYSLTLDGLDQAMKELGR